jgi:tetratricopeptide (TPR) repeat protein
LSRDAGVSLVRKFVADGQLDLGASLLTAIAGFGFYIKKLVIPWPLNFTIFEVPEYYLWVGLLGFFLLAYCTWRRDIIGGLFLAAACIGLSAILVLLLRPAWTPVAERYLYLPSTFFCLALVLTVCRLFSRFRHPLVAPLVLTLFFTTTAYATFERNLVWQDNVRLFEDTVSKSPDFPFARSVLADLRREAGREAESKAMIQANTAPEGLRNADFLDLKRVELLLQENSYEEARALILESRRRAGQLYYNFQRALVKVDHHLVQSRSGPERQEIVDELVSVYQELIQVTRDPFYHYRLGQFHLQESDRTSATRHFSLAAQQAPEGVFYKKAAAKLAEKLSMP